jgi:3-hydroxyacyl-[acyl-carrier-protein] dehydratase
MTPPKGTGNIMPLDAHQIRERLPHAPPFLFLDEITELDAKAKVAYAVKCFKPKEFFFKGHFPGRPIVPGVILTEALAQLSGLLLGAMTSITRPIVLAGIQMKFRQVVLPDQIIRLCSKHLHSFESLHGFEVDCSFGPDRPIADGQLTLAEVEDPPTP